MGVRPVSVWTTQNGYTFGFYTGGITFSSRRDGILFQSLDLRSGRYVHPFRLPSLRYL